LAKWRTSAVNPLIIRSGLFLPIDFAVVTEPELWIGRAVV
jgi:hypothetical protein